MSLTTKNHLNIVLKTLKTLISQKLSKEDYYTDEEVLQFLSDSVNMSPIIENGNYLVEGDNYLVV